MWNSLTAHAISGESYACCLSGNRLACSLHPWVQIVLCGPTTKNLIPVLLHYSPLIVQLERERELEGELQVGEMTLVAGVWGIIVLIGKLLIINHPSKVLRVERGQSPKLKLVTSTRKTLGRQVSNAHYTHCPPRRPQ